jgi:hypothetical protein
MSHRFALIASAILTIVVMLGIVLERDRLFAAQEAPTPTQSVPMTSAAPTATTPDAPRIIEIPIKTAGGYSATVQRSDEENDYDDHEDDEDDEHEYDADDHEDEDEGDDD